MKYYPSNKRSEVLTYATTSKKFENITLNEIDQTKDKHCVIPLTCNS